jgi:hypothetical protein
LAALKSRTGIRRSNPAYEDAKRKKPTTKKRRGFCPTGDGAHHFSVSVYGSLATTGAEEIGSDQTLDCLKKMREIGLPEKAVAYLIDFLDSFGCNMRLVESVVYHESRLCGK